MILSSKASRTPRSRLPILRRDLSTSLPMQELQTLRFPWDRFWPGAMRCQMPSLTHNRDLLIAFRMEGSSILYCLLSTSSRRSPICLLKEGSLRLILIFWIYYGTGFRIIVMCLCLSRRLLPWNDRLDQASSPTTFSPGRWWP